MNLITGAQDPGRLSLFGPATMGGGLVHQVSLIKAPPSWVVPVSTKMFSRLSNFLGAVTRRGYLPDIKQTVNGDT